MNQWILSIDFSIIANNEMLPITTILNDNLVKANYNGALPTEMIVIMDFEIIYLWP